MNEKFSKVIGKNVGLETIKNINNILAGSCANAEVSLSSEAIASFKFSPITSVDVERSFSQYKSLFWQNRQSFLFINLKKHLNLYCNSNF